MLDFIVFFSIIIFSAFPVSKVCFWLYSKAQSIDEQLEIKVQLISFSRYSLVLFVNYALHFAKGFLIPFICSTYFIENDTLLILSVAILLGCHFWSFLLKFTFQNESILMLWGLYTFLSFEFMIIFPILFLILSVLSFSFLVGRLLAVLGMFFFIWFLELQAVFLPINFIIFLVIFVSYYSDLIDHIDKQSHSILMTFKRR